MALTASTVAQHSCGDLKMHIVTFASVATAGDTWTSKIPGIVACWATGTTGEVASTFRNGISCGLTTPATGVITIVPNTAESVKLFVLSAS